MSTCQLEFRSINDEQWYISSVPDNCSRDCVIGTIPQIKWDQKTIKLTGKQRDFELTKIKKLKIRPLVLTLAFHFISYDIILYFPAVPFIRTMNPSLMSSTSTYTTNIDYSSSHNAIPSLLKSCFWNQASNYVLWL